jgi:hypothetical protein
MKPLKLSHSASLPFTSRVGRGRRDGRVLCPVFEALDDTCTEGEDDGATIVENVDGMTELAENVDETVDEG